MIAAIIALALLLFLLFCFWQNSRIAVSPIEYKSRLVPRALDGYIISHVSDLHNRRFARGPEQLASLIRAQSPNIIAITGDFIDSPHASVETAMRFARLAAGIAPVYYAPGNHEFKSGQYQLLVRQLTAAGVHVLDDRAETVEKNGGRFVIAGLRDPAFFTGRPEREILRRRESSLRRMIPAGTSFSVLLSHRPELLPLYQRCGVSLALTGHAHGGQVRLPGIGGLYAPGQGIFPKYTSGMHQSGSTTMIVSRGLGGAFLRFRVFNTPEIVVVRLKHS